MLRIIGRLVYLPLFVCSSCNEAIIYLSLIFFRWNHFSALCFTVQGPMIMGSFRIRRKWLNCLKVCLVLVSLYAMQGRSLIMRSHCEDSLIKGRTGHKC